MKTTKPPRTRTARPAPAKAAGNARDGRRIAKLLARAGIASRREIERMIAEGRIALDGKAIDTPATVLTSLRGITVDGQPVQEPAPARLFLFHKPAGVLTTERDPKGRPTIYDRLPKGLPRVVPVGRLDYNTEGLLLLTTDGGLKRQLELPSSGVERSYRARAFGDVSQDQLEALIQGVEIEGIRYGAIDANLERRTGRNQWIEMKLTEGKNREVRRVLEHLGLEVSRLIRTAYGPFVLGDLPVGAVEEVRRHDLIIFRKDLGSGAMSARRTGSALRTKALPSDDAPAEPAEQPARPAGKPAAPRQRARPGFAKAPSDANPRAGRPGSSRPGGERERPAERPAGPRERVRPGRAGEPADGKAPRRASARGPSNTKRDAERSRRNRPETGEREDRRPPRPSAPTPAGSPGKPRRPGSGSTSGSRRPGSPRPPRRGPKS